jgi:hypothetical protein
MRQYCQITHPNRATSPKAGIYTFQWQGGNERKGEPPTECLIFKLWDRRLFVLEHSKANPNLFSSGTKRTARNGERTFAPKKNTYYLEFLSARSLDGTDSATNLWFLELLKRDVLGEIARGSEEAIVAKRAWLKKLCGTIDTITVKTGGSLPCLGRSIPRHTPMSIHCFSRCSQECRPS